MKVCLYLLLFMFPFTAGCLLSGRHENRVSVTGYTGGSVLLPCSCADNQSTVQTFIWRHRGKIWNKVLNSESCNGRLKLFNESLPTNLSLLISDLRKEDEGLYRCETSSTEYRDIMITVKGCDLVQNKETVEVTGRPGESVVLPCYCKEQQEFKPKNFTWTYYFKDTYKTIYPTEQSKRNMTGVKLSNETFSGNLSLLISDLNYEHQGVYRCSVRSQHADIKLIVEEKWHIQTICLSTHIPAKQTGEFTTAEQSED